MTSPDDRAPDGGDVAAGEAPPSRSASDKALLFVGSLGYLGFVPFASGTVAVALAGVPFYLLLALVLGLADRPGLYLAVVVAFTLLSIWVAGHADRVLDEKDSKKNVIDELPGYFVALIGLPVTWQLIVVAFFVERAIDIAKVWPANWIERRVPGGWGVVLDDVVAGLYTLGLLHLGVHFWPDAFGVLSS